MPCLPRASRWLLFAALVVGVGAGALGGSTLPGLGKAAAANGARGGPQGPAGVAAALHRLAVAAVVGVLVGGYVSLEVVPRQVALQVRALRTLRQGIQKSTGSTPSGSRETDGPSAFAVAERRAEEETAALRACKCLCGAAQALGLASCMAVVAFVCLLPMPAMRGPLALPALAAAWFMTFGVTMLLQVGVAPVGPPRGGGGTFTSPAGQRALTVDSQEAAKPPALHPIRVKLQGPARRATQRRVCSLHRTLHALLVLDANGRRARWPQAELPPPEAPVEMRRLFPDSHRQVRPARCSARPPPSPPTRLLRPRARTSSSANAPAAQR